MDNPQRGALARLYSKARLAGTQFTSRVPCIDEATFFREVDINQHNMYVWENVDSHFTRSYSHQHPFTGYTWNVIRMEYLWKKCLPRC